MARILYDPTPSVSPSGAPSGDYENIQASPAAFGSLTAGAEQRLGGSLEQAGNTAFDVAIAQQELHNRVVADDSTNRYQDHLLKVEFGDPNDPSQPGFNSLHGADSLRAYRPMEKDLEDYRQQIRSTLNPRQMLDFDAATRRMKQYTLFRMGDKANREADIYNQATQKGTLDLSERAVALDPNNDETFKHSVVDRDQAIIKAMPGAPSEEVTAAMNAAHSRLTVTRIEAMVNGGNTRGALDFFNSHKQFLDEQTLTTLMPRIRAMKAQMGFRSWTSGAATEGAARPAGNNNPGNLMSSNWTMRQPGYAGRASNGTAIFTSPEAGASAMAKNLSGYAERGVTTLSQLTASWAPTPSGPDDVYNKGNNPAAYASRLSTALGIGVNDPIDLRDPAFQKRLMPAMAAIEHGHPVVMGSVAPQAAAIGDNTLMTPWEMQHYGPLPGGVAAASIADVPTPGLPDKAGALQKAIADGGNDPAQVAENIRVVNEQYAAHQADYIEQERAQRVAKQQREDASDQAESKVMDDLYSPVPTMTIPSILANKSLTLDAKRRMIAVANRVDKGEPLAEVSRGTMVSLLDRMRRPQGDPMRIYDKQPLDDALIEGRLSRTDYNFLRKEQDDARSPQGEKLSQAKSEFMKRYSDTITRASLAGRTDPAGADANLYRFEWDVDRKIDQYKKDGKDPFDLFNPSKPEFIGSPEAMSQYQMSLSEAAAGRAKQVTGVRSAPAPTGPFGYFRFPPGMSLQEMERQQTGAAPVRPAPMPPRQPGETPAQYFRRRNPPVTAGAPPVTAGAIPEAPRSQ